MVPNTSNVVYVMSNMFEEHGQRQDHPSRTAYLQCLRCDNVGVVEARGSMQRSKRIVALTRYIKGVRMML